MGVLVHHLATYVKLLENVVARVLGPTEATVRNLQLPILVCRGPCTTTEKVILALQLCKLVRGGDVELFISSHTQP
jgi:hypothetical protein